MSTLTLYQILSRMCNCPVHPDYPVSMASFSMMLYSETGDVGALSFLWDREPISLTANEVKQLYPLVQCRSDLRTDADELLSAMQAGDIDLSLLQQLGSQYIMEVLKVSGV